MLPSKDASNSGLGLCPDANIFEPICGRPSIVFTQDLTVMELGPRLVFFPLF